MYKYIIILILCLFIGCNKDDALAMKNIGHFIKNKMTKQTGLVVDYDAVNNSYRVRLENGDIFRWYSVEVESLAEQE